MTNSLPHATVEMLLAENAALRKRVELLEQAPEKSEGMHLCDELRVLKEREQLQAKYSNEMIARLAADGTVRSISPGCHRVCGYTPQELIGCNFYELVHSDDRAILHRWQDSILKSLHRYTVTYRLRCKGGHYIWLEMSVDTVRDFSTDRVVEMITVSRDYTPQKRLEKQVDHERALLQAVLDSLEDGLVVIAQDNEVVTCNRRFLELWNLPHDWVQSSSTDGRFAFVVQRASDSTDFVRQSRRLRAHPLTAGQGMIVLNDGRIIEWSALPFQFGAFSGGRVWRFHDGTHRKRTERALSQAHEQLVEWVVELEQRNREATLINEMSDLLLSCHTFEEVYEVIAQTGEHLFPGQAGMLYVLDSAHEVIEAAATWGNIPPMKLTLEPQPCRACWEERHGWGSVSRQNHTGWHCRNTQVSTNSATFPYLCVPLMGFDGVLGMLYLGALPAGSDTVQDRWERLAETFARSIALALANLSLRLQLHSQSIRDPLTGIYNRRYLDEALDREIRRAIRHKQPIGIVMLDIDHFKKFNDTYGHEAGDILLQAMSAFIQMNVRSEDIACRYGGEEFLLILSGASLGDTWRRAEQLRLGVEKMEVKHRGKPLHHVTISLGIASFPRHGMNATDVVNAADAALYRAKTGGRNRVVAAADKELVAVSGG
jgi:diguanylate cyclase (GGDEF)-like protein/PAS domain S-box-containing protein